MIRISRLKPLVTAAIRKTLVPTQTSSSISLFLRSSAPLQSLLPPLHQFLQSFPVSGTPKGKARLKMLQALKKKSFTQKKKGKGGEDPRKGGRGGPPLAKTRPIILRLNACLRRREAEREKLGLVSKLRQRDVAIQNARAKKEKMDPETEGPTLMGPEGMSLTGLGFVDAVDLPSYRLTVEDGRRLAKEYSRVLMRWDRERQEKEMGLLRLRKEAIEALPEKLRIAALMSIPKKKKRNAVEEEEKKKLVSKGKKKTTKRPGMMVRKKGGGKPHKKG